GFAGPDEVWIIVMGQRSGEIVVGKFLAPFERDEMEAGLRFQLGQQIVRLSPELEDGRDLTCLQLLDCEAMIDKDRLDVKAEALEYHRTSETWTRPFCQETK